MSYFEMFSCWADVQQQFEMSQPAPEDVLFAGYEYANYSGEAYVLYRDGGKLWLVSGSHCSCNGLEGQWEPEETTRDVIATMVKEVARRAEDWGDIEDYILARYATEIMVALGIDSQHH